MQKLLSLSILFVAVTFAHASFGDTGFPATVSALQSIRNAHRISLANDAWAGGPLYRGSDPTGHVTALRELGITHVLIFKKSTGTVEQEKQELAQAGFKQITSLKGQAKGLEYMQIPFPWDKIPSFQQGCTQVATGLRFLRRALLQAGNKAYFHCTVGEDRTGLLAGTYRLLYQKEETRAVFYGRGKDVPAFVADEFAGMPPQGEMCGRGYEAGDPGKEADVNQKIRQALTPLFTKLAYLIRQGRLTPETITHIAAVCAKDPENEPEYRNNPEFQPAQYACPPTMNPVQIGN